MKKKVINQREALKLMQEGKDISLFSIEFNDEYIEEMENIYFIHKGIDVPKHLIYCDRSDSIYIYDQEEYRKKSLELMRKYFNVKIIQ